MEENFTEIFAAAKETEALMASESDEGKLAELRTQRDGLVARLYTSLFGDCGLAAADELYEALSGIHMAAALFHLQQADCKKAKAPTPVPAAEVGTKGVPADGRGDFGRLLQAVAQHR
jgi:hypothetical protein